MYKEYVRERMRALREHKKREDPDAYREASRRNMKRYYDNLKINNPEKYQERKDYNKILYWKNLKDKIEPEEFLRRFILLEKRNPEQAQLVKEKLRL